MVPLSGLRVAFWAMLLAMLVPFGLYGAARIGWNAPPQSLNQWIAEQHRRIELRRQPGVESLASLNGPSGNAETTNPDSRTSQPEGSLPFRTASHGTKGNATYNDDPHAEDEFRPQIILRAIPDSVADSRPEGDCQNVKSQLTALQSQMHELQFQTRERQLSETERSSQMIDFLRQQQLLQQMGMQQMLMAQHAGTKHPGEHHIAKSAEKIPAAVVEDASEFSPPSPKVPALNAPRLADAGTEERPEKTSPSANPKPMDEFPELPGEKVEPLVPLPQAANTPTVDHSVLLTAPGNQPLADFEIRAFRPAETDPNPVPRFTITARKASTAKVLEQLGRLCEKNILAMPGIDGELTFHMERVTAEEAFRALLHARQWTTESVGLMTYVKPVAVNREANSKTEPAEFAASAEPRPPKFTPRESVQRQHPDLTTKLYQPLYADPRSIHDLVTPLLTPGVGQSAVTGQRRLPESLEGAVAIQEPAALLVKDLPAVISAVDRLIAELDVPPPQVQIQVDVIEVPLQGACAKGVNLRQLRRNSARTTPWQAVQELPDGELSCGVSSCAATEVRQTFQECVNARVLDSPTLTVVHRRQAELVLGHPISHRGAWRTSGEPVSSIHIRLRPIVAADGLMRIDMQPERLREDGKNSALGMTAASVDLQTSVLVRDGHTILLGGWTVVATRNGWLWPGMGNGSNDRRQIFVLLTPRLMTEHCSPPGTMSPNSPVPAAQPMTSAAMHSNGYAIQACMNPVLQQRVDLCRGHMQRREWFAASQQVAAGLRECPNQPELLAMQSELIQAGYQSPATPQRRTVPPVPATSPNAVPHPTATRPEGHQIFR